MTTPTPWSSPEGGAPGSGAPEQPAATEPGIEPGIEDHAAAAAEATAAPEPTPEPTPEQSTSEEPTPEEATADDPTAEESTDDVGTVVEVDVVETVLFDDGVEIDVVEVDVVEVGVVEVGVVEVDVVEVDVVEVEGPPPMGPTGRPVVDFPEPPALAHHGPARVVAICNQKGGVGKTTSAINLGAALAGYGRRVLLLDFDPQGALSAGLGVNPNALDVTVYDLLMRPREVAAADVVIATDVPGLDLLPANIDLSAAEVALVNEVAREQSLARAIAPLLDHYDDVLIDCQPSLGLLTVNALAAADGVIIPLECEYFALRGMKLLVETIEKVQERINPRLRIEGILATMYDARTVHRRQVLERVVEAFGDTVFHTVISQTVKFPETTVAGTPITEYAPSSAGAAAYRALARELVARRPAADRG